MAVTNIPPHIPMTAAVRPIICKDCQEWMVVEASSGRTIDGFRDEWLFCLEAQASHLNKTNPHVCKTYGWSLQYGFEGVPSTFSDDPID